MGGRQTLLCSLLLLLLLPRGGAPARILYFVQTPSVSHSYPMNKMVEALLERGHHVTHITADPLKTTSENYTLVDVSSSYSFLRNMNASEIADSPPRRRAEVYNTLGTFVCNHDLNLPQFQVFVRQRHQFDLVIWGRLMYQCFYGMLESMGYPPLVGVFTLPPFLPAYSAMGNPVNPAYMVDPIVGYSDRMTFWERLWNTYYHLQFQYYWWHGILPEHEAIMRKHFGPTPRSVYEVERNYSLLIISVHFSGEYPKPHLPNIIEVTGLHVKNTTKPLPRDIQEYLDGARHGVVYFSLGSNVRSNVLPEHRRRALIDAFRQLPERVLWKFEDETIPGLPGNVLVRKWLPQQDILAHPNVKVFITQGGLQSFHEASYHGVPFIGIPFFADQEHNVATMVAKGIGVQLRLRDISKETVLSAIRTVLDNPRYQENMERYSRLFREHQATSMERAIWWLEYVIRHKGAPHMRSAALDLHWWQLLLLDVIGFVLLVAVAMATAAYFVLQKVVTAVRGARPPKAKAH